MGAEAEDPEGQGPSGLWPVGPQAPSMTMSVCLCSVGSEEVISQDAGSRFPSPFSAAVSLPLFSLAAEGKFAFHLSACLGSERRQDRSWIGVKGRERTSLPAGRASDPTKIVFNKLSPRPCYSQNNLHVPGPFILFLYQPAQALNVWNTGRSCLPFPRERGFRGTLLTLWANGGCGSHT